MTNNAENAKKKWDKVSEQQINGVCFNYWGEYVELFPILLRDLKTDIATSNVYINIWKSEALKIKSNLEEKLYYNKE